MKIGDKVRFLSEVGGGVVTGFQGKDMVLVEDADGFDIPIQIPVVHYKLRSAHTCSPQYTIKRHLPTIIR